MVYMVILQEKNLSFVSSFFHLFIVLTLLFLLNLKICSPADAITRGYCANRKCDIAKTSERDHDRQNCDIHRSIDRRQTSRHAKKKEKTASTQLYYVKLREWKLHGAENKLREKKKKPT